MKWHDEWKGTNEEVKDTVDFYLNEIMNEFDVDRKTAKKYLSEALSRNNIVSTVKEMCNYLQSTY
jgi:translation initiation factor 2 beta subunit (eIF-2beta)/eIF-5